MTPEEIERTYDEAAKAVLADLGVELANIEREALALKQAIAAKEAGSHIAALRAKLLKS